MTLAESYSLSATPVFSLWILIPGLLVVLVLTFMLYMDQKRVASHGTVLLLTLVRIALVLLLAMLFLQPSLRWWNSRSTAGTLWVVVDQSPSMATPDPQALPGERLRWAEAAGFVTTDPRDNRPDILAARMHQITGEFAALEPIARPDASTEAAMIADYARLLSAWNDDLRTIQKAADSASKRLDALAPSAGAQTHFELDYAAGSMDSAINAVRDESTLHNAVNAFFSRRYAINNSLLKAEKYLLAAAARDDADFLRAHAGDGDLNAGIARIKSAPRQTLAWDFLASPDSVGAKPLQDMAQQYHLRLAGFADRAQATGIGAAVDPAEISTALKNALATEGQGTNLENALRFVSEQIGADEAASVIVVSDGRNNAPGDATGPARALAARGVHVYGLLIGSHEVSPDAAIDQIDNVPSWIYKGDSLKPRALVRLDGLLDQNATVELLRDGQVVDSQRLKATEPHTVKPIEFSDKPPDDALSVEYTVRVSEMPGEVNTQNNSTTFRVQIKKDKLYALVIEDRPRWEYRYLSSELDRDQRLKVQTVLESPAFVTAPPPPVRASPDNPNREAQLLPTTVAEWEAFDVIVLGDIGPDVLPPAAQQAIAAAVRDKGATLIVIAGQRSMPAKFTDSALAEILPVTLEPQWSPGEVGRHAVNGFRPMPAPTATNSVMTQFDMDPAANLALWNSGPLWYWHSPFTRIKPAAQAIWTIEETLPPLPGEQAGGAAGAGGVIATANKHALLATMNVGAGKTLFLASDQSWRLRQVSGEDLHGRFWGQVLRWAVGSDLPAGGKFVRFGANKPTFSQDETATITARILHDDLTPYTGLSFSAVARPKTPTATTVGSGTANAAGEAQAQFRPMQAPGYYTAEIAGMPLGDVEISLKGEEVERLLNSDPSVTQKTLLVKVEPSMNTERRNMNTDPEYLDALARSGGGYSLDGQYADVLLSRLPKIEHVETTPVQVGFFADPSSPWTHRAHWAFLALFALLITAEWALRKRAGMV